ARTARTASVRMSKSPAFPSNWLPSEVRTAARLWLPSGASGAAWAWAGMAAPAASSAVVASVASVLRIFMGSSPVRGLPDAAHLQGFRSRALRRIRARGRSHDPGPPARSEPADHLGGLPDGQHAGR